MCEIMKWLLGSMIVICGVRDFRKREIPTWWLIILSVIIVVFIVLFDRGMYFSRFVGALLGLFFFFVSKCTKEAIGYGDSWLILVLGIYLGGFSAVQVLFWAALIAAVAALFQLWRKRWKRNIRIPFIPCLAIAYIGVVCV